MILLPCNGEFQIGQFLPLYTNYNHRRRSNSKRIAQGNVSICRPVAISHKIKDVRLKVEILRDFLHIVNRVLQIFLVIFSSWLFILLHNFRQLLSREFARHFVCCMVSRHHHTWMMLFVSSTCPVVADFARHHHINCLFHHSGSQPSVDAHFQSLHHSSWTHCHLTSNHARLPSTSRKNVPFC